MMTKSVKARRRITQADYRAAGRGLTRDCDTDIARGLVPGATPADIKAAKERLLAEAYECNDCGHRGFGAWNCYQCGGHNLTRISDEP